MPKLTILIIDDSIVMSHFLVLFLEKNYNIITYTDSTEALHAIQNGLSFNAILTDLDMPQLSGLQLIKAVRDLELDMPIAVLTANKESNIRIQCLELGADECITKPFNPIELNLRIDNLMRGSHLKGVKKKLVPVHNHFREFIRAAAF